MNHFGKIQTMFVIKSKQDLNLNQSQSLKMITLKDISILLMNLKKKRGYFNSDDESTDDESTDIESIHEESYNESKTDNNTSIIEKNITKESNTGENLVIDDSNTLTMKPNNTKQSEPESNSQNPDNKN